MEDLIVVAYVWGFGNIGDTAITPGLLNLLRPRFPDHRAVVVAQTTSKHVQSRPS